MINGDHNPPIVEHAGQKLSYKVNNPTVQKVGKAAELAEAAQP